MLLLEIVEDFSTLDFVTYFTEEVLLVLQWHHIEHQRDALYAPAKHSLVLLAFAAFVVFLHCFKGLFSKFRDLLL